MLFLLIWIYFRYSIYLMLLKSGLAKEILGWIIIVRKRRERNEDIKSAKTILVLGSVQAGVLATDMLRSAILPSQAMRSLSDLLVAVGEICFICFKSLT